MLARGAIHRAPQAFYLDFLAPFLFRNKSTHTILSRQRRNATTSQRRNTTTTTQSQNPPVLANQITQAISLLSSHEGVIPPSHEIDLFNETVRNLKKSLQEPRIAAVRESWLLLEEKNMLHFLGLPQLESYSRHIANIYVNHPKQKPWSAPDRQTLEEIAIFSAAGGHTEALNTIMNSFIKVRNPTTVLDLYQKYVARLSDFSSNQKEENAGHLKDDEHFDPLDSPLSYSAGRADIFCSVITACAMLDSFQEAVRIVLNTNTYIPVKKLPHGTPDRPKVADYVERLGVVRMLGQPPAFVKHVSNLVRTHSDDRLEQLYDTVINGILGPNPWLNAKKRGDPTRQVTMQSYLWKVLITAFMKCGRPDLTERLWDDMIRCDVQPEVSDWTAIFDGYNTLGAFQEALGTWDAMISQGIKPEPLTYRAIIATLFNCRRPKDAMKKYQEYERNWASRQHTRTPSVPDEMDSQIMTLHNTVLHGLFTNTDKESEALKFFQKMQTQGPQPDIVSWNILLGYYSRRGNLKMITGGIKNLRAAGLSEDVFTYSIVLSALLKAGRADAPELIIAMMKKNGIERNATVNTTIIDQILQVPDAERLQAVFSILNRMESEQSVQMQPNEVTYTTILTGIYRGTWQSKEEADAHRKDILRRMQARDIQPSRTTYHILFKACFDSPDREGYRYALDHYTNMVRQRIAPTFDTWYILLDGLLANGHTQIANDMVDEMLAKWYKPEGGLARLVDRIRKSNDRR